MEANATDVRAKLIGNIIRNSTKVFGEGSAQLLSSKDIKSIVSKTISTGSPPLDRILARDEHGRYGLPGGRIVGISGKEASGKTTLIIELIKSTQKMGGLAALIETEHAFDPNYAQQLDVNLEELVLFQPDYLEQGLDMVKLLADQFKEAKREYIEKYKKPWNVPMFIGFDSIAGVPPKAEWEADSFEKEQAQGLHARRLSKFFRNISGLISSEEICLACTNQTKTDTRVMYGDKKTEIGGMALKFHASVRLDIYRSDFIRLSKESDPIGIITTVKTVKNKVMIPYKSVMVPIIFGKGIDYARSMFLALKALKKIRGGFTLKYRLNDELMVVSAKGENAMVEKIRELTENSPKIRRILERKLDPKD
jgi:recombination protein RecA